MIIENRKTIVFVLLCMLLSFSAQAQDRSNKQQAVDETEIQDDVQDELNDLDSKELSGASSQRFVEIITPLTDSKLSVLSRKVQFSKKYLIDLSSGLVADELVANNKYSQIKVSYYSSEEFSFGLGIRSRYGGKTAYAEQLLQSTGQLEFSRAPAVTQAYFLAMAYNIAYGKVSFTKSTVFSTLTKADFDFGIQMFKEEKRPFIQVALTQSLFLSSSLAVGLSLGASIAEVTDPTTADVRLTSPLPSDSSFTSKFQSNAYLSINLNVLL